MIKHKGFWAFLMLITVIMVVVTTFYSCQNLISEKQKVNSIEKYLSDLHENKFFNGAIIVSDDDQIIYSNGFWPCKL